MDTTMDLVKTSMRHLMFLEEITRCNHVYQDYFVTNAIHRYLTLWMPLKIKYSHKNIIPPLDIYWIWLSHMQKPDSYHIFCTNQCGQIIEHVICNSEMELKEGRELAKELWNNEYPNEHFYIIDQQDTQMNRNCNSKPSGTFSELKQHVEEQRAFIYQVSLPHYKCESFIENAVKRYSLFLKFKSENKTTEITPPNDIDLVWRTHMLHPSVYLRNSMTYFGCHLLHPGIQYHPVVSSSTVKQRTNLSMLLDSTEPLKAEGTVYRGSPPINMCPSYDVLKRVPVGSLFLKNGAFRKCCMGTDHATYEGCLHYEFSRAPVLCTTATHR